MKKNLSVYLALSVFLFSITAYSQTWGPTKRLTWNSGTSGHKSIAVDNNNTLHLIWTDDTPGNYELFYRKSTDGGATWSASKRITYNSGWSHGPVGVTDSSNHLHVLWRDDSTGVIEIYYKKSTDGGATWSVTKRLTYTSAGIKGVPRMDIDTSNNLHAVWYDSRFGNEEIIYKRSTDGGATWSAQKRMTFTSGWSADNRVIIVPGNDVYILYGDDTPGNEEIFYKKSTDSGVTWSAPKRLTYSSGDSREPQLAFDSSLNLFLIYNDETPGNQEIFYKKSTNAGGTWSSPKRMTYNSGDSEQQSLSVDGGDILHMIWSDNTSTNQEIYHKKSTDGGFFWSTPKRLTYNSGSSIFPTIALDSLDDIHMVWNDDTPGNYEVYYKKGDK